MGAILDAMQWLSDFFGGVGGGLSDMVTQAFSWIIQKVTVYQIKAKLAAVQFAWGVAKDILSDLQVTQGITETLSLLPQQVRDGINFFRVPECITNVLTAYTTRYVLRFLS